MKWKYALIGIIKNYMGINLKFKWVVKNFGHDHQKYFLIKMNHDLT